MAYSVKEIFKTLQGEGAQAGRAAVFCRFAGCNLWSGREQDRASAICQFCDTDFIGVDGTGGRRFADAEMLANSIEAEWSGPDRNRLAVLTGGEPLLQVDQPLIDALHERGFEIAVETNGTITAPKGLDWICVSPKAGAEIRQQSGTELKIVFPQEGLDPAQYEGLDFEHFFLQPMDCADGEACVEQAIAYCVENPNWRLSLQSHKMVGIR